MNKQRIFHFLTWISVLLLWSAVFWHVGRDIRYARHWPKSPRSELGRVIPHPSFRSTVFISRDDDWYDLLIEVITLFSGVSVIALFLVGKKGRNTASEYE